MAWLEQNWLFLLLVIGMIFMMRRGGMCGGGRHHRGGPDERVSQSESDSTTDPVSRQSVDPKTAVTSVYQGKIYYFVSRENRDLFEAKPEQYAAKSHDEHRSRHGCC